MKARITLVNKYLGTYAVIFPNGDRIDCANYSTALYYMNKFNYPLEVTCSR